jgi:predicted site-specific integrase-resolvase
LATPQQVAIYARVSSAENKSNLDRQAERLEAYCAERLPCSEGGQRDVLRRQRRPSEASSAACGSEHRLDRGGAQVRLTQFGFRYLDTLLENQGRTIEVINQAENGTEDLLTDLTAIVFAFCARLHGQRRAKRKTETIVRVLEAKGEADATG